MSTLQQKLMISLVSAVVFVLLNLPHEYTHKLLRPLTGPLGQGTCTTPVGMLVHAVVFYLVTRYVLMRNYTSACEGTKHKRALIATVIFALLSSPMFLEIALPALPVARLLRAS
jgi:hypothetical protein